MVERRIQKEDAKNKEYFIPRNKQKEDEQLNFFSAMKREMKKKI